jgi:hypothetical protein
MLSLLNALEINRRHTLTELIHRHALRRSWRRELKQPRVAYTDLAGVHSVSGLCGHLRAGFDKQRNLSELPKLCHILSKILNTRSVGITTGYGLDGPGSFPVSERFFPSSQHPDRIWGPSRQLSNGYRGLFPRG